VKGLRLSYCHFDDDRLGIVCDALLGNTKMKSLCLKGNTQITSTGWRALSNVLQHPNCKLTNLNLGWTKINDEGAIIVGGALSGSSVKSLNLSFNHSISSTGWQTFINQLSQSSVKDLDLNDNKMDDTGLEALANIDTLTSLDVSGNKLCTPLGWRSFFNSLRTRGAKLVKLGVSSNNIGDSGIAILGNVLGNMTTLKTLKIGCMSFSDDEPDNITTQGWQVLFTTLQDSDLDLVKLHLIKNNIDDEGIQLLMRLVTSMSSLKHLSLSCNYSVTPTTKSQLCIRRT